MYLISRSRIEASGIAEPEAARRLIERTLRAKAAGTSAGAQEVAMAAGAREAGAFYSLPAYLGGEGVAGLKWTSHVPGQGGELPYTQPVILLNDLKTGTPIALLEGQLISGLRTGAVSAAAVSALTEASASSLLLCGSGFQARHQLRALLPALPGLQDVHLWSRTPARAERLQREFAGAFAERGIRSRVHAALPPRLDFARVIVGATSAARPYLRAEHFAPGQLYVHIGMRDIEEDAVEAFDEIVCDDFEAGVPSSSQSLFGLARRNPGIARKVTLLENLLEPERQGLPGPEPEGPGSTARRAGGGKVMFNAFGLSIFDLALAHEALRRLQARPGVELRRFDPNE
ncbi:hypothetical protein QWJ34_21825 [Saccharibacillus sp. CPCC 101409]|uniref:hypothetical protein n=1 Tax=Saccharibacillus sp. CPCC 101409 TaxID=3058041 RepID=UPI002673D7E1|nr:hypothetical protein [Saccharibacillus sp. CPCC 101409]MDO3412419.1 hypothetical protein [Saccharibacillus sp. CPCC 101409]